MNKIKVLVLDPTGLNPATWWRLYGPFNRIAKHFHEKIEVRYSDGRGLLLQELGLYDVVVFYITLNQGITDLVQHARAQGCRIVLDCDDDVFNLDPSTPEFQDYDTQRSHLTTNFLLADEVWCSTDFLRDSFNQHPGKQVTIPNAIDPAALPTTPNTGNRTAVWRGSSNHVIDYTYGMPWFEGIKKEVNKWLFFGYWPPYDYSGVEDDAVFIPRVPPERYFTKLKSLKPEFLWKPLKPCRQNDAKSNISWIEATMAGAVCVTNYTGKPGWEHCFHGFLEPGNEDWNEDLWATSVQEIWKHYDINEINLLRVERLAELSGVTL